jgi:hypothetical protein
MVECLKQYVPGCFAELIFNLNEVGTSEWEASVPGKVIVPMSMSRQTIRHGGYRNLKHILVACCVSVAGESRKPFIARSQANNSAIEKLRIKGFRMGSDAIREDGQRPYMSAALFQQYI